MNSSKNKLIKNNNNKKLHFLANAKCNQHVLLGFVIARHGLVKESIYTPSI